MRRSRHKRNLRVGDQSRVGRKRIYQLPFWRFYRKQAKREIRRIKRRRRSCRKLKSWSWKAIKVYQILLKIRWIRAWNLSMATKMISNSCRIIKLHLLRSLFTVRRCSRPKERFQTLLYKRWIYRVHSIWWTLRKQAKNRLKQSRPQLSRNRLLLNKVTNSPKSNPSQPQK